MSSSKQGLPSNNLIIDIPPEYVEIGKTLLIEKYFELFVDGYHLSKPAHFIKHIHQLCLVDTQHEDQKSVNAIHQLQPDIDENQLVQLIIEVPCQSLNLGKSLIIEKINSNGKHGELSGNIEDLYNHLSEIKDIHIKIPQESLQRGKTIVIQKEQQFVLKTDDYQKQQMHHLNNNSFARRDHLQSKNMMEITVEVPPEFFNDDEIITIRKEDPQALAANFPYRRQSKPGVELTNKDIHIH